MNTRHSAVMAVSFVLLAGCGSNGIQTAGIDRGGITDSTAVGTVDGFGSIVVNNTHYETSNAAITVNGQASVESELQVGHVVTVKADPGAGNLGFVANEVDFSHDVIGPIETVSIADDLVFVLGQTIIVDTETVFGAGISPALTAGIAALPANQILRISGFRNAQGDLLATRIETGEVSDVFQVVGESADLDAMAQTFSLGDLTVAYSTATITGFTSGVPQDGDRLVVRGSTINGAGQLVASVLEAKPDALGFVPGDTFELEGPIDTFNSSTDFSISGIAITTSGQTSYEGGVIADLAVNVRVEVEGEVDGSGALVADQVEFKSSSNLAVWANVESVSFANGTLRLSGVDIDTDAQTVFEDKSPAELRPFGLGDINPGDPVRVTGIESAGPGLVLATRVERSEPLQLLKLRGVASNVADPTFTILGVAIFTNSGTDTEDDFFMTADGRVVVALGNVVGGDFIAEKVEIKD